MPNFILDYACKVERVYFALRSRNGARKMRFCRFQALTRRYSDLEEKSIMILFIYAALHPALLPGGSTRRVHHNHHNLTKRSTGRAQRLCRLSCPNSRTWPRAHLRARRHPAPLGRSGVAACRAAALSIPEGIRLQDKDSSTRAPCAARSVMRTRPPPRC